MALRLIEVYISESDRKNLEEALSPYRLLERWEDDLEGGRFLVRVLVREEDLQGVLDGLTRRLGRVEGFRVLLVPVLGAFPLEVTEGAGERASREELFMAVQEAAGGGRGFLVLAALSSVVASVGLVRDSAPLVIGAMVIAPLLGPNMALALGTVLGKGGLVRRAAAALLAGLAVSFCVAFLLGCLTGMSRSDELLSRGSFALTDLFVALAAGGAGAIAFSRRAAAALVGVMVAVALLPPLAAAAIFLAVRDWSHAAGAALLFAANLIAINLAAVASFRLMGLKPSLWWKAETAKRRTAVALLAWAALLGLLALIFAVG